MWDHMAGFETATLENGLTVHVTKWPDRPWQSVCFLIHSGALQDAPGREGTAHHLEHVVSENTEFGGAEDINDLFEDLGGKAELGSTSWSSAHYSFFVPNDRSTFARALNVFGRMLLSGKMERQVERERTVILGEFNREYEYGWQYDRAVRFSRALHPGLPFAHRTSPLGSPESIAAITAPDLQAYYDRHYQPHNISVVSVGGLGLEEVLQLLRGSPFAVNQSGVRTSRPSVLSAVPLPLERKVRVSFPKEMAASGAAYMSAGLLPGTVDTHVLTILLTALNKKLFREVREKRGWTYDINATWASFAGYYGVTVDCSLLAPEGVKTINEVVSACVDSLVRDASGFEDERRRLVKGSRLQDGYGRRTTGNAVGDLIRYGKIMTIAEHEAIVGQLTSTHMDEALAYLKDERRLSYIVAP